MKHFTDSGTESANDGVSTEDPSGRREFLKKAGKFAIYTPPVVMMLTKPSFAGDFCQKGSWSGTTSGSWTGGSYGS